MTSKKDQKPTFEQSLASTTASLRVLTNKLLPHFGFIFSTFILLSITLTVYIVSQIMQSTDIGEGTATTQAESSYSLQFDQATIAKLKDLKDNSSSDIAIPSGRINPFSESVY